MFVRELLEVTGGRCRGMGRWAVGAIGPEPSVQRNATGRAGKRCSAPYRREWPTLLDWMLHRGNSVAIGFAGRTVVIEFSEQA